MAVGQALGYKLKVLALLTKFYVLIYVLSFIFNEFIFHFSLIEEKWVMEVDGILHSVTGWYLHKSFRLKLIESGMKFVYTTTRGKQSLSRFLLVPNAPSAAIISLCYVKTVKQYSLMGIARIQDFLSLMAGRLAFWKAVQINNFLEFYFLSFWLSLNSSIFLCLINGSNMCVLFIWKWRKAVTLYKFQLPLCSADKDGCLCLLKRLHELQLEGKLYLQKIGWRP